ncbi:MAG: hypothetical protein SCH66_02355 [Methanolobus sp.]|nr:hypothetical protein [Methanolobus sp.]
MDLTGVNVYYTGKSRELKGDIPKMMLRIDKHKRMKWKNEWEPKESVAETVRVLVEKGGGK